MTTKINDISYTRKIRYLREDDLWEAALEDGGGNQFHAAYGETKGEAIQDLQVQLQEKGIKEGQDNKYLPWESLPKEIQRKILVKAKGIKSDLLGEWMGDRDRYEEFRSFMLKWTTEVYGYTTPIGYGEYNRL